MKRQSNLVLAAAAADAEESVDCPLEEAAEATALTCWPVTSLDSVARLLAAENALPQTKHHRLLALIYAATTSRMYGSDI